MKVLIIEPLKRNREAFELSLINEYWKEYKDNHPKCSFDLEVECRVGTDINEVGCNAYCYFYKQDIDELIKEIETMIAKDEIIGLIINPILTYDEEKMYIYHKRIPGNTLATIYNIFKDRLPICYYFPTIGDLIDEPIINKINEEYRTRGYVKGKRYEAIPYIYSISSETSVRYFEYYFNYFIDFYNKRQEEGAKLLRTKKEEKDS